MKYLETNCLIFMKRIAFLPMLCALLIGCQNDVNTSTNIHSSDSELGNAIQNYESQKALELIAFYYGGELEITEVSKGPSGTLKIEAIKSKNGKVKTLYMLPDQQHLIEGTLYSPHMSKEQISNQHSKVMQSRAHLNDTLNTSKEEMRKTISNAIAQNQTQEEIKVITQSAITKRTIDAASAKKGHNQEVAKTIPNLNRPPETASLPRNHTVVDTSALFERIENADWISSGENKKVLYVFYDFRCSACLETDGYLEEYSSKNEVQVRYLPVGALGQESQARATLSLIPHNNETRVQLKAQLGKPLPLEKLITVTPSPQELQRGRYAALKNLKILMDTNRVATPTFAYMTKDGPIIRVLTSQNEIKTVINSIIES